MRTDQHPEEQHRYRYTHLCYVTLNSNVNSFACVGTQPHVDNLVNYM